MLPEPVFFLIGCGWKILVRVGKAGLQAAGVAGGYPGRGSAAGSARPARGRIPHPGTIVTHAAGQKGNIVLLSPDF